MKKKILITAKSIDIESLRSLKKKFILTYKDEPDVAIIIDDYYITIKDYTSYTYPYRHCIETSNSITLDFIAECFEKTYDQLTGMHF